MPTSQDHESQYEKQILHENGRSLLERTIDFIRDNVDIEDVYRQTQIRDYAAKYLRIQDVYSIDDIEDYRNANLGEEE